MSVKLEKVYRKELHKALEKCQFIEETLRMCIFSAVEIARLQLSPHFPIKYKTEDISKLPLGALVNIFSKINNDTGLHESLRKIHGTGMTLLTGRSCSHWENRMTRIT